MPPLDTRRSYLSSWLRSTSMEYVSMVIQEELAHSCVTELGRLGSVQLVDLNPHKTAFQRRYVAEISRVDVMERRLRYFFETLQTFGFEPEPTHSADDVLDALSRRLQQGMSPSTLLAELETLLQEREQEVRALRGFSAQLTQDLNSKIELKHVLDKTRLFARDDPNIPHDAQGAQTEFDVGGNPALSIRFRFLAGTVDSTKRVAFERMVFRVTRGNCYMRFSEIEEPILDPVKNVKTKRDVFIVFYQAQVIEQKLRNVCSWYEARTYDIPNLDSQAELDALMRQTQAEITERQVVVKRNKADMSRVLSDLARHVNTWRFTLAKEKATYHAMNLMMADVAGVLRAEGWVVATQVDQVADVIASVHRRTSTKTLPNWVTIVPESQRGKAAGKTPTHFETNKFTEPYQLIIDTYGIAKYKEINPAVVSAITFPFCFGVMFGDVGHGTWLMIFVLFLIAREKALSKVDLGEIGNLLFGGRYVLVLMALFSIYAGLIYNDVMALGVALFNVTWFPGPESGGSVTYARSSPPQVYPFGADPTWRIADNEISFYNSFKMKFAVIFGVIHMMIGLGFKAANARFFHQGKPGPNLDLWFEAVPQILFMLLLFGYMDFLIVYKWAIPWGDECDRRFKCSASDSPSCRTCQPPSLITTMINMVLSPGQVTDPMFPNQGAIQVALVLIAVAMIPLMLCVKPYVLVRRMREKERRLGQRPLASQHHHDEGSTAGLVDSAHHDDAEGHDGGEDGEHEEHGVGDIVVHQGIETIEFVLGGISNTASYLRLWALSLAHSQLAAVFWERTLLTFLVKGGASGVLGSFVGCGAFLGVTLGVLMAMDNLECFLHALRLTWVEFDSKFYKAEGIRFDPIRWDVLAKAPAAGA